MSEDRQLVLLQERLDQLSDRIEVLKDTPMPLNGYEHGVLMGLIYALDLMVNGGHEKVLPRPTRRDDAILLLTDYLVKEVGLVVGREDYLIDEQ